MIFPIKNNLNDFPLKNNLNDFSLKNNQNHFNLTYFKRFLNDHIARSIF